MKLQDIEDNLKKSCGITQLNPMQLAMAAVKAPDVLLLAPTGSGKTAAFILLLLQRIKARRGVVQGVILAPSRELALQIFNVLRPVATGLKTTVLYGGHRVIDEINSLREVPDIVVATPGRLLDHLERGTVSIDEAAAVVYDEYDKILELGFEREVRRIAAAMRQLTTVVLTSATRMEQLPAFLDRSRFDVLDFLPAAEVRHNVPIIEIPSHSRDKLPTLIDLLHTLDNGRVIVFVNHRESAERVYDALKREGFPVGLYHGGLEQRLRAQAVDLLENGTTPILVSTDIASRGLDIADLSAVIHYHLPTSPEAWTHRNGRTGRQSADGQVYVITSEADDRPEYIQFTRTLNPSGHSDNPIKSNISTLYINAGKKEKISRGDIAGYMIKTGGLEPDQVGLIKVSDHSALVAVPADTVSELLPRLNAAKLKNTRVKVAKL